MTLLQPTLKSLGFPGSKFARMKKALDTSVRGAVIIAGSTGSGKTMTMLAALRHVEQDAGRILFAEESIREREMFSEYVDLTAVPAGIGAALAEYNLFTPAHHMDEQFVYDSFVFGELRDEKAVKLALQLGQTQDGYTFGSLHAHDAVGTLQRLSDITSDANMFIARGTKAIVAQSLMRELCSCKEPQEANPGQLAILGLPEEIIEGTDKTLQLYVKKGCAKCYYKGYKKRFAVHEIFLMDEEIEDLLINKADLSKIEEHAKKAGMTTMVEDAWEQVKTGKTSVVELLRTFPNSMESNH